MSVLGYGYTAEVDTVGPDTWYEQVASFADGNLYQLWQHGSGAERFTEVSRFLLRRAGRAVAVAEVRTFRLPVARRGIAYVLWGPVWKRRGRDPDPDVFVQAIKALNEEYVHRRGLVLRLNPRVYAEGAEPERHVLLDEGFTVLPQSRPKQTLLIDLARSIDDLRKGLDKKWRNCLSKAERSGLVIEEATDDESFDEFVTLYTQLLERKQLAPSADIQKHRRVQQALPGALKMRVVLARHGGKACAGALISAIGDTAVYLFGATNDLGMRTCAAYLVQWHCVTTLKGRGFGFYDLNGIDPVANPGVYHFKRGLGGRDGREVAFIGQFQAARPSLSNYLVLRLEELGRCVRMVRARSVTVNA